MDRITEIRNRIEKNKETYDYIVKNVIKASCPSGYSEGTSYVDADTIKGSRKEIDMSRIYESLRHLESIIYLDEIILENLEAPERIREKLESLDNNKDKVYYLRNVEKLTQEKAAEIMGISTRQVQRIEAEDREQLENKVKE